MVGFGVAQMYLTPGDLPNPSAAGSYTGRGGSDAYGHSTACGDATGTLLNSSAMGNRSGAREGVSRNRRNAPDADNNGRSKRNNPTRHD